MIATLQLRAKLACNKLLDIEAVDCIMVACIMYSAMPLIIQFTK